MGLDGHDAMATKGNGAIKRVLTGAHYSRGVLRMTFVHKF